MEKAEANENIVRTKQLCDQTAESLEFHINGDKIYLAHLSDDAASDLVLHLMRHTRLDEQLTKYGMEHGPEYAASEEDNRRTVNKMGAAIIHLLKIGKGSSEHVSRYAHLFEVRKKEIEERFGHFYREFEDASNHSLPSEDLRRDLLIYKHASLLLGEALTYIKVKNDERVGSIARYLESKVKSIEDRLNDAVDSSKQ